MVPGTGIQINGSARATTYISANQVSFVLPASDVAAAGKLNVTAVNPVPNYSVSAAATLTVANPTANPGDHFTQLDLRNCRLAGVHPLSVGNRLQQQLRASVECHRSHHELRVRHGL